MTSSTLRKLSRGFLVLGLVAFLVVVLFLGSVVYSLSEIRPEGGPTVRWSDGPVPGVEGLVLTVEQNISNPGLYSLDGVVFSASLWYAGGSLLHAEEPSQSLSAGSASGLGLSLPVNLTQGSVAAPLLTHNELLERSLWINASYADVFQFRLSYAGNLSWKAPFLDLAVTPAVNAGGFGLTVSYQNPSPWNEVGTLEATLVQANGTPCVPPAGFPVDVPSGGAMDQTFPVPVGGSCDPAGGSASLVFLGSGFALPLGGVPLP